MHSLHFFCASWAEKPTTSPPAESRIVKTCSRTSSRFPMKKWIACSERERWEECDERFSFTHLKALPAEARAAGRRAERSPGDMGAGAVRPHRHHRYGLPVSGRGPGRGVILEVAERRCGRYFR